MKNLGSLLLLATLFLASCSSFFKVDVFIDNPSTSPMSISFDSENFELAGKQYQKLKLVKGEHYIKAEQDGEVIFDGTISITQQGVVNLTQNRYVLHRELYLKDQEKYELYAQEDLELQDVEIDDKTYQNVDFKIFEKEEFIPEQWDYSFFEDLPTEIKTTGSDYKIITKLYRQEDLEDAWGFNGNFDFTGNSDADLQHFLDSLSNYLAPEEIE